MHISVRPSLLVVSVNGTGLIPKPGYKQAFKNMGCLSWLPPDQLFCHGAKTAPTLPKTKMQFLSFGKVVFPHLYIAGNVPSPSVFPDHLFWPWDKKAPHAIKIKCNFYFLLRCIFHTSYIACNVFDFVGAGRHTTTTTGVPASNMPLMNASRLSGYPAFYFT